MAIGLVLWPASLHASHWSSTKMEQLALQGNTNGHLRLRVGSTYSATPYHEILGSRGSRSRCFHDNFYFGVRNTSDLDPKWDWCGIHQPTLVLATKEIQVSICCILLSLQTCLHCLTRSSWTIPILWRPCTNFYTSDLQEIMYCQRKSNCSTKCQLCTGLKCLDRPMNSECCHIGRGWLPWLLRSLGN